MAISTGSISTSAGPLDVANLVSQLVSAESKSRLTPLSKKADEFNSLISAYGTLKNALSTYQTALQGLSSASFSAQKASVANGGTGSNLTTDPFTADVNADESTKVLSQKLKTSGFSKGQIFRAGDSMAIKVGSSSPTFVTLKADATITGVRDAINASKAGVTASVITDETGEHLVLESNAGGTANAMKVAANNSLSALMYDPARNLPGSMTQLQAPRNAAKAASGSYSIGVSQLAQAQKVSSAAIAPGSTFENGILAIKTGTGSTAIIKPASNTLAGVRDAINSSEAGVTAAIVSDGKNEHLVITSKQSGEANTLRISGTGQFSVFSFDPSGAITTPPIAAGKAFSSGGLSLKVGGRTVNVSPTSASGSGPASLADTVRAINDAKAGVVASTRTEGSQDYLVLTPTGADSVSLSGSGDFSGLAGSSMGQLQKAQDAKIAVDGVGVTSTSNKIKDAISGVTLNLTKVTTSADKFTLAVTNDTSGVSTAANTFVSAYNTLAKAFSSMTRQTPSTTKGQANNSSPLASESSVRNIMTQLRGILLSSMGGNEFSSLSAVGISFQKDGTLTLDATKLTNATSKNFEAVSNLFSSKNGLLPKLQKILDDSLGDNGIIAGKTKGLQASLKTLTDQQTAAKERLTTLKDSYTNQFNRLNITLAKMQSTQNYLTQQLAKLKK